MTIRLRPHHLLCLLTYVGKGYTPAFTANYTVIAGRLSRGEEIEIVSGPDDVCAPLLSEAEQHCFNDSVVERDRLAARDVGALVGQAIAPGTIVRLEPDRLAEMRAGFATGQVREACVECEWSDLCSAIAADGYGGTLVQRTAAPC